MKSEIAKSQQEVISGKIAIEFKVDEKIQPRVLKNDCSFYR